MALAWLVTPLMHCEYYSICEYACVNSPRATHSEAIFLFNIALFNFFVNFILVLVVGIFRLGYAKFG